MMLGKVIHFDAGASSTSSERGVKCHTFWAYVKLFKNFWRVDAPNLNVIVKERRTYALYRTLSDLLSSIVGRRHLCK